MLSILKSLTLQKDLHNLVTKNVFWKKNENTITTKQKIKHEKPLGNRTRDLSHSSQMCYLCITESTNSINCCQAV